MEMSKITHCRWNSTKALIAESYEYYLSNEAKMKIHKILFPRIIQSRIEKFSSDIKGYKISIIFRMNLSMLYSTHCF